MLWVSMCLGCFNNMYVVNHKYIGCGYGIVAVLWGYCGGYMSLGVRICVCSGCDIIISDSVTWLVSGVTWHALWMVFMFVMGVLLGMWYNKWLCIWIGCGDVGLPGMNDMSMLMWCVSGNVFIMCMCVEYGGGVGWTLYPPCSVCIGSICGMGVTGLCVGLWCNGTASTLSVVNWLCTVFNVRCWGVNIMSSGVGICCVYVVSSLLVVVLGILTVMISMLVADVYGCGMWFEYMGNGMNGCSGGGDSVLYQHLFWVFGHPEVYVMLIPGMGVVSVCVLMLQCLYGNGTLCVSLLCLCGIGGIVWSHHMYRVGLDVEVMGYFTVVTLCVGIPTGCKLFAWCCSGM